MARRRRERSEGKAEQRALEQRQRRAVKLRVRQSATVGDRRERDREAVGGEIEDILTGLGPFMGFDGLKNLRKKKKKKINEKEETGLGLRFYGLGLS